MTGNGCWGPACPCSGGPAGAQPSRRLLLGALAAAGTGLAAQDAFAAEDTLGGLGVIDVHHHLVPPAFVEADPTLPDWVKAWRPEHSLENMDRFGVATAMTSLNAPGLTVAQPRPARKLSRACNEYAARLVQDHPGRLGMFASLAPLDVDGAVQEAIYALDVLKADGVALMTSYGKVYLTSPRFAPLFEELDRRAAVVFVHPTLPTIGLDFDAPIPPILLEMPFETARTLMGMVLAGTFARYPNIRFIFNHGGGALPVLHRRLDLTARADPKLRDRYPEGIMAALKNVHFDTVNVLNPANFALIRHLIAMDRLLFGTDFPGFSSEENVTPLKALAPAEIRAIARDNAVKLFPRLAAGPRGDRR